MKIKISAKFRASRRLRFEDTKRIVSPEKFRDFRETGPRPDFLRTFPLYCFSSATTARIIYTKRLFLLIILICRVAGAFAVLVFCKGARTMSRRQRRGPSKIQVRIFTIGKKLSSHCGSKTSINCIKLN